MADIPSNPIEPELTLKLPTTSGQLEQVVHPQQAPRKEDSAVTKAERVERHVIEETPEEPPTKRVKLEPAEQVLDKTGRPKGVAPIKAESVNLDILLGLLLTID